MANPSVTIILDASGMPFIEGTEGKPDIIKPNLYELETAFHVKLNSEVDILSLAKKIIDSGTNTVCISMGKDGAIIVSKEQAFKIISLQVPVKSAQGAGDSLVTGLCYAISLGKPLNDILCYGVAMTSATIMWEGTLMGEKKEFETSLDRIQCIAI